MKYAFVLYLISLTIDAVVFGQQASLDRKIELENTKNLMQSLLNSGNTDNLIDNTSSELSDIVHIKIRKPITNQSRPKDCENRVSFHKNNEKYLKLRIKCDERPIAADLHNGDVVLQPTVNIEKRPKAKEAEDYFKNFLMSISNERLTDTTNADVAPTNILIHADFLHSKNNKNCNSRIVMREGKLTIDCISGEQSTTSAPMRLIQQYTVE